MMTVRAIQKLVVKKMWKLKGVEKLKENILTWPHTNAWHLDFAPGSLPRSIFC